jgi:hypothetical protein
MTLTKREAQIGEQEPPTAMTERRKQMLWIQFAAMSAMFVFCAIQNNEKMGKWGVFLWGMASGMVLLNSLFLLNILKR